nr:wall-associated receptor kinase 2 [Quercus suber]
MNTCKHAFLAETWWLESNETDPSNDVQYLEYVPVMLEWTIPTAIINLNGTKARRRNIYLDHTPFGTTSYCLSGYEGNPYLNMGCQDINECEDQKYATCQVISNSECENTEGSYSCKMREKQKSPLKTAIIVICTSFGASDAISALTHQSRSVLLLKSNQEVVGVIKEGNLNTPKSGKDTLFLMEQISKLIPIPNLSFLSELGAAFNKELGFAQTSLTMSEKEGSGKEGWESHIGWNLKGRSCLMP